MHGRCDNNHGASNGHSIIAFALLHPQPPFPMQQISCDLQTRFDYRLFLANFFFRFISTYSIWKAERRRGFLTARVIYDWWPEAGQD